MIPTDDVLLGTCLTVIGDLPEDCIDLAIALPHFEASAYADSLTAMRHWFEHLLRIVKPGRRLIWLTDQLPSGDGKGLLPVSHDAVRFALEAGWLLDQEIAWTDPAEMTPWPIGSFPRGPSVRMRQTMGSVVVFQKPGHIPCKQLDWELEAYNLMDRAFFRDRVSKQVWQISRRALDFPNPLIEPCIRMWSRPEELVFSFMDNGATALASLKWRRHFLGCESDPERHRLAEESIAARRMELLEEDLMVDALDGMTISQEVCHG